MQETFKKMAERLEDDLNIAASLADLFEMISEINKDLVLLNVRNLQECLLAFEYTDKLLGLDISAVKVIPEDIKATLVQYSKSRKEKAFAKSDALRKDIEKLGWLVKDGRPGEPSTVKKIRRTWDVKK